MAETKYTYSVSEDFPNQKEDSDRLTQEIADSSIITALNCINTASDICDIWFVAELSTGDHTILDAVVAAHSGSPLPIPVVFGDDYILAEDSTVTITTATDFQQKLRLGATGLKAGLYRVSWSYECVGSNQGQFMCQVQVDDIDTIYEVDEELRPSAGWRPCSGFGKVTLTAGDHFLDLDYCTSQKQGAAKIRRVRLEIMGIGE